LNCFTNYPKIIIVAGFSGDWKIGCLHFQEFGQKKMTLLKLNDHQIQTAIGDNY
jgi:hypothetical protein